MRHLHQLHANPSYIAGSIVRVKITGFMTYDHVEFRPGPHLNMILGPNGTGKSSIAAAIAIGLGFHPKVSLPLPPARKEYTFFRWAQLTAGDGARA